MPSAQAMDYVKCEAIQRAAARLKASMGTEDLEAQNASVLPAMGKAQAKCSAEFSSIEILNYMGLQMAHYEAEGTSAREAVIDKYAPRINRALADYEAEGCY